jgi:hypothetical protein
LSAGKPLRVKCFEGVFFLLLFSSLPVVMFAQGDLTLKPAGVSAGRFGLINAAGEHSIQGTWLDPAKLADAPSNFYGHSSAPPDSDFGSSTPTTAEGDAAETATGEPAQIHQNPLPATALKTPEPPKNDTRIRWRAANEQALLSTGIMHTFNIWTEAGTRDALNGPWLKDYLRSVGELRGWSDSDRFMAPYVGHTLQGAIFGYILRQNDPKYRDVQYGDGRDYYLSLLRSMGFSAIWHTQWKIGPASEDSIGNVMLHASPGFITLVDTPTLGTVDMFAEDVADRYIIMGLENRTTNRALIMLTRCFLNPGRSFANLMAFKLPWNRDTRMGVFGENYLQRKQEVAAFKAGLAEKPFQFIKRVPNPVPHDDSDNPYPKAASIELSAYPNYESFGGKNCIGGGGSGAARLSNNWQIVSEVNGCLIMGFPASNISGDSLFYGAGGRWTPRASHRWSPFAEVLFGGRKVTYDVSDQALMNKLLAEWNDGSGTLPHYPKRSDWSTQISVNGPSIAAGGGVDWVIKRPFAWRLITVQYTHSWIESVNNIYPQNGYRITTEAVLRIGTW